MKIIFLDIDGVLNVYPQGHDDFGSIFHKHFEDNLKEIIDKTGAKLVISSTWRASGLNVMKEMWSKRGIPGEVIDVTTLTWEPENDDMDFYERCERGNEIQVWLNEHPEVTNYVILDDDSDMLSTQMDNFVKTSGNTDHTDYVDGGGYGLTKECVQKAVEILNRN